MEIEKSIRRRINIKETAKRDKYFECTVDMVGFAEWEVLAEIDGLVKELEKRYPATLEAKKDA